MALRLSEYHCMTQAFPPKVKEPDGAFGMGPELWAALVGAVVAGVIGLGTQYFVIRDNKKRRDADYTEAQSALGRSVFIKTIRIQSSFHSQLLHIVECNDLRKEQGLLMRHATLRPLGNLSEKVDFKPEELGLISRVDSDGELDEFLSLDTRHNSILSLWTRYRQDREALESSMEVAAIDGTIGTVTFRSRAEHLKVLPAMLALEDLIKQLEFLLWCYLKETTELLDALAAALTVKLGTKREMNYKDSFHEEMTRFRSIYEGTDTGSPQG